MFDKLLEQDYSQEKWISKPQVHLPCGGLGAMGFGWHLTL
jgi:hypothetical protein